MYAEGNPTTKKQLKEWVASNRQIRVFQLNDMFGFRALDNMEVSIEGPHYPQPHKWYARVRIDATGLITKVIG